MVTVSARAIAISTGWMPELSKRIHSSARTRYSVKKFLADRPKRRRATACGILCPPALTRLRIREMARSTLGSQREKYAHGNPPSLTVYFAQVTAPGERGFKAKGLSFERVTGDFLEHQASGSESGRVGREGSNALGNQIRGDEILAIGVLGEELLCECRLAYPIRSSNHI